MAYLQRVPSSAGNRRKFTMSAWLKPMIPSSGSVTMISCWSADNVAGHFIWRIKSDGTIGWSRWSEDSYSTRKLKDENAWYHCVIAVDTTQATASDRIKLYVNNEQITSFSVGANYPAQNTDLPVNNTTSQTIGLNNYSSSGNGFKGYMSHFHLVDGLQLTPSTFGSTDSTTGEWKINTNPTISDYGTCGFFMFKDDNSANDDSGKGNNFTLNGTLPKSEDNPSNVFATINPLVPYSSNYDFYNGNTTVENDGSSAAWTTRWGVSTLGMSSGKFYAEAKIANIGTNQMYALGLIKDVGTFAPSSSVGANGLGYYSTGNIYNGISGQDQTGLASYTTNDIIGLAIDATNGSAQWYKNGSAIGNAETIATDGTWFFVTNFYTNGKVDMNYGNGYFGTTAVASAGTNASGIGIFEYNVPTGYTALSTKGLNL